MKNKYRFLALGVESERRIFYFLCAAVAFSIPFKASWNSILSVLLLVFWFVFLEKRFEIKSLRFKLLLLLSGLFFVTIIGLIYTKNIEDGLFRVQQKAILFIFPLVFGTIVNIDFKKLSTIMINAFISGLFLGCVFTLANSAYAFFEYRTISQFYGQELAEWINLYPYIFSLYCLLVVLFLFEGLRRDENVNWLFQRKSVAILGILFFTLFILLLSVKQALFSWLIVSLVYSFLLAKSKWHIVAALVGVSIILIISVLSIPSLKQKGVELFSSNGDAIILDHDSSLGRSWNGIVLRKAIWTCSFDVIKENVWIGVGSGDGQDKLQEAYELRKFYFASRYNRFNAHNEYIQVLVNFGVLGLCVLLFSLFTPLYILRSDVIFIMFTFCFLSIFLTESIFEVNKGVIVYAVFNSLLVMWKTGEKIA